MTASPKDKTSTVVTATLVGLALLGVGTIFWEPLAALAVGAPPTEGGDVHAPTLAPATTDGGVAPVDASGNS
jgi:hypothetical protein